MREIAATGAKGVFGGASGVLAYLIASVGGTTAALQLCGAGVAVLVGLLTGVSIAFDIRKKWREQNKRRNL